MLLWNAWQRHCDGQSGCSACQLLLVESIPWPTRPPPKELQSFCMARGDKRIHSPENRKNLSTVGSERSSNIDCAIAAACSRAHGPPAGSSIESP